MNYGYKNNIKINSIKSIPKQSFIPRYAVLSAGDRTTVYRNNPHLRFPVTIRILPLFFNKKHPGYFWSVIA